MDLDEEDAPHRSSIELAQDRTDLAFERSRLASDRTTMGYMRTAISLIGFGFSIPALFKVLTSVPGLEEASLARAQLVGVSMLLLAVFMLVIAILQQVLFLRRLAHVARRSFPFSVALAGCVVVLVIAFIAAANIILNIEFS